MWRQRHDCRHIKKLHDWHIIYLDHLVIYLECNFGLQVVIFNQPFLIMSKKIKTKKWWCFFKHSLTFNWKCCSFRNMWQMATKVGQRWSRVYQKKKQLITFFSFQINQCFVPEAYPYLLTKTIPIKIFRRK